MKHLIFSILLLLFAFSAHAQIKGSGILYFQDAITLIPNEEYGSEWAYVIDDSTLYRWSRDEVAWVKYTTSDVYVIATAADTTTITSPNEGDFAYVDTTLMFLRSELAWVQFSGGGGGSGGGGAPVSDTSRHSHTRLTFGNSYSVPIATLDTADIISVYGGALGAHVTITLPTLPDTSYDGKIIYVRGSATEDGTYIMRVTSTDSSDVLVQGCQSMTVQEITPTDSTNIDIVLTSYANTSGPDTITTSMGELRMYIISNGKYYRYCQYRHPVPKGGIFQIDMTTAATSTTVDFNAPTSGENGGIYTFHFQNTDSNDVDFPAAFKNQAGVAWDSNTTYAMNVDFFMTCYYDGTNYHCK